MGHWLFRRRARKVADQVDERRAPQGRCRAGRLEANAAAGIVVLAQHLGECIERHGVDDRVGEVHGEGGPVGLARPPRQVRYSPERPAAAPIWTLIC